ELMPREAGITPAQLEAKRAAIDQAWPRVQSMAEQVWGLKMERGPLGIDTRLAHVGAKVAEGQGKADLYHKATFEAYWQRQEDLGDADVLVRIAASVGMDEEAFRAQLEDAELLQSVLAEQAQARRIGIGGV